MRTSNRKIAGAIFTTMLVLICSQHLSPIVAQHYIDNSYEVVTKLCHEFEQSRSLNTLTSLANLVRDNQFGPNAIGGLTLLARKVTREQAESVVIPALIGRLNSTNIAVRRGVAIALSEYSAYITPVVVPALTNFLDHSQESDKRNADYFMIEALGRAGKNASSAIPALLRVVDWQGTDINPFTGLSLRGTALAAIDQIGFSDNTTRLRLEKALNDKNSYVKFCAASALIDNKFVSEAALATLSETVAPDKFDFRVKPVTLQLIRDATTNSNPSIKTAARTLLKRLEK